MTDHINLIDKIAREQAATAADLELLKNRKPKYAEDIETIQNHQREVAAEVEALQRKIQEGNDK